MSQTTTHLSPPIPYTINPNISVTGGITPPKGACPSSPRTVLRTIGAPAARHGEDSNAKYKELVEALSGLRKQMDELKEKVVANDARHSQDSQKLQAELQATKSSAHEEFKRIQTGLEDLFIQVSDHQNTILEVSV